MPLRPLRVIVLPPAREPNGFSQSPESGVRSPEAFYHDDDVAAGRIIMAAVMPRHLHTRCEQWSGSSSSLKYNHNVKWDLDHFLSGCPADRRVAFASERCQ